MNQHTQCKLQKDNEFYTAWIPSKIAKIGNVVSLKEDKSGEWLDNWTIKEVFTTLPSETVQERSQDYKKTRKASDI